MGANICEKDCWKCSLEGCPYTLRSSLDLDQELQVAKTDTARQRSIKRYNESPKRKKVQARYRATKKGKEANLRNTKAYYQKHREEYLQKQHERYAQNKEYYRNKRREYYLKQKERGLTTGTPTESYRKSRSAWVIRFEKRNNRLPTENELLEWKEKYMQKRKRKELMESVG